MLYFQLQALCTGDCDCDQVMGRASVEKFLIFMGASEVCLFYYGTAPMQIALIPIRMAGNCGQTKKNC